MSNNEWLSNYDINLVNIILIRILCIKKKQYFFSVIIVTQSFDQNFRFMSHTFENNLIIIK